MGEGDRRVDSRTSGERRVMITVGETMRGIASTSIQAADTGSVSGWFRRGGREKVR